MRNAKADFAFLVSWWAPNADAEAIRTLVDWQHWAFPWDDQFDEGHFKEDMAGAAADIIHMTSILDDSYPPIPADTEMPIRYAFQQNWFRIRKVSPASFLSIIASLLTERRSELDQHCSTGTRCT